MSTDYHPDLRVLATQLAELTAQVPALAAETLGALREGTEAMISPPLADIPVRRCQIPALVSGQPDVTGYLINQQPGRHQPAIIHMHGGGFVLGCAQATLPDLQQLCRELDCVALSVDYRLAPEATYRQSREDNYAALAWLHHNASELGVDPHRIAVMGESAGGGHAAMLAILARDRGEYPIAFQCLIYPMLDDRTGAPEQFVPAHVGKLLWKAESNYFGWCSLLGEPAGHDSVPVDAVPARTLNLSNLPPAFIGAGTLDLLCDESIEYAQRLNLAGVTAELQVVPGAFHGFDNVPIPGLETTTVGEDFRRSVIHALRLAFEA